MGVCPYVALTLARPSTIHPVESCLTDARTRHIAVSACLFEVCNAVLYEFGGEYFVFDCPGHCWAIDKEFDFPFSFCSHCFCCLHDCVYLSLVD